MLDISFLPGPGPLGPFPPPPPPETEFGGVEDVGRGGGDEETGEEGMCGGVIGGVGGFVGTGTKCVPHVSSNVFFM